MYTSSFILKVSCKNGVDKIDDALPKETFENAVDPPFSEPWLTEDWFNRTILVHYDMTMRDSLVKIKDLLFDISRNSLKIMSSL